MSERIRAELQRRMNLLGMNRAELSKKAGLGPTAVRDILEERVSSPTEKTLRGLARVLGCTVGDLTGEAKKAPSAIPADLEHVPPTLGVPEIDVIAGMGAGGEALVECFVTSNGDGILADTVRDYWGIPDEYLSGELRISRKRARIIEVRGDSMEPTLKGGDRVMIDVGDQNPTPGGPFAIWDGFGVAVKRLERIERSDPPAFEVISDNPAHKPKTMTIDEIRIIGRVIWFARRMG